MSNSTKFTYLVMLKDLKVGNHIMLKKCPCKITNIHVLKTSKYGYTVACVFGIDIFTDLKHDELLPYNGEVQVPYVTENKYILIDIMENGYIALMDDKNNIREDMKLIDDNLSIEIKNLYEKDKEMNLIVLNAMEIDKVIAYDIKL